MTAATWKASSKWCFFSNIKQKGKKVKAAPKKRVKQEEQEQDLSE